MSGPSSEPVSSAERVALLLLSLIAIGEAALVGRAVLDGDPVVFPNRDQPRAERPGPSQPPLALTDDGRADNEVGDPLTTTTSGGTTRPDR